MPLWKRSKVGWANNSAMKKLTLFIAVVALLMAATSLQAQNYGIVFGELEVTEVNAADIFGDGMASYDAAGNMLVLQDGFEYHLSHGLVTINTGRPFRIVLEGDAIMVASIESGDPVVVEAVDEGVLKITSNISGSALKCQSLTVQPSVLLDLLSRNSQDEMYALDCKDLTVNQAIVYAEVTTAQLAVHVETMTLNESWLQKPRGGFVNTIWGGICFGDGTTAKIVRIIKEGFGINEIEAPEQQVLKVFEDGHIVIEKDGKRYDVTGREL